jgi:hypothetical protein
MKLIEIVALLEMKWIESIVLLEIKWIEIEFAVVSCFA